MRDPKEYKQSPLDILSFLKALPQKVEQELPYSFALRLYFTKVKDFQINYPTHLD